MCNTTLGWTFTREKYRIADDKFVLFLRGGLRIGELLKIRVSDVSDRTITLREPKSGKESERAYMPENVSKKTGGIYQGESHGGRGEDISHLLFDGKIPGQGAWSQIECPCVTT